MIAARETFLHYLQDNLAPIAVHNLRRDPDDPDAERVLCPAVNVQFHGDKTTNHVSTVQVYIDVVNESEWDATGVIGQVSALLTARFFTEKFDYSDPANPKNLGTTLSWNPERVIFRPIWDDNFYRAQCNLTLNHVSSFIPQS